MIVQVVYCLLPCQYGQYLKRGSDKGEESAILVLSRYFLQSAMQVSLIILIALSTLESHSACFSPSCYRQILFSSHDNIHVLDHLCRCER